jgi:acetylornithine deacetylase/succinyl-diaminopimelate desuccinylase-like protein
VRFAFFRRWGIIMAIISSTPMAAAAQQPTESSRGTARPGPPAFGGPPREPRTSDIDFEKLRDEAVRLLVEYLRLNTTNPPGNELASARWLKDFLDREGIEGQILDTAELGPGRANFYARLKGDGSKRAIALVHHMDVVPASSEHWSVDPFGGTVKDGYVWGRGALDMKADGVVHLMTMVALKRAGVPLTRDLVFVANADEEAEGLGAIIFTRRHPELLRDVEYLLTEGGGTRVEQGKVRWLGVGVAEKRAYWVRLAVRGTPSHGSIPTKDNPVPRLARAVERLAAWETPLRVIPAVDRFFSAQAQRETGERREWLTDAAAALRTKRGRDWLVSDPYRNAILRNTVTPTVLAGSTKTNIIPPEATAEIDIRLLPDEDTARFTRELERVIGDSAVTIEVMPGVLPVFNAPIDTELFRAIERTAAQLLPGIPVATPLAAGATDRPTYSQAGIIAYGLDPFLVELDEERRGVHGNDERVSVENLGFGLRLYVGVVRAMQ